MGCPVESIGLDRTGLCKSERKRRESRMGCPAEFVGLYWTGIQNLGSQHFGGVVKLYTLICLLSTQHFGVVVKIVYAYCI